MSSLSPAYIELHARSAFSFLHGASTPEALIAAAARLELPALALCDRDGVYGAPRLFGAARDTGVRPFVGTELTLADGSILPLLAATRTGYENLCQLLTRSRLDPRPPTGSAATPTDRKRPCHATWAELAAHAEGLIALTGDEHGPIRRAWRTAGPAAAAAALAPLLRLFGPDRLYVELQRLRVRGEERELTFLRDFAAAHHLPILATGGIRYATRAERPIADVFTCLHHHTTLDTAGRLLAPNAERHLKSARTMHALFADCPGAVAETTRLAARLDFTLRDLGYQFPSFPVPAGETMASWLHAQTYAGARTRFLASSDYSAPLPPAVRTQLDRELVLIDRLGFNGYFLIVWDICTWARSRGILVQGRGSAANSAVCYALGITAVDPIKHRLLFERFLSEGRVGHDGRPSWPDIDLDLPSGDLREQVIQEVYARYAPHGAAMTANVITYRGRSASRELGKVLGLPDSVIDRFSSLYASGDYPHTLDLPQQLAASGLPASHPRLPAFLSLHAQLRGLPRHLSQHSGGMVICGGRLDRVVPLEPATMPGRVILQWDKDDCEDLGIVKVDFLGLGMMAVLQDSLHLCTENTRGPRALHEIPPDDPATFAAMQRADTIGVFQIESRAQMSSLRRFKPACLYDVAMQVAIVRPGPIVAKLTHPLLRRRLGLEPVVCIDPSVDAALRPILERTYGVILFQEQMLQVAMTLAGFNATEAEQLRRAMGFTKGTAKLERALAHLTARLRAHGHNDALIATIIDSASSFALYGFPESHSISFALLAYASTWLKVHRPAEFLACLLNHQPMGFYSPATLVQDARRHGVSVRPVCVARSHWVSTVEENNAVRLGLIQVSGLHADATRAMIATRAEQPFDSLDDWLRRTHFSPAERRALAALGALNCFAPHRRAALWQVAAAWSADESLLHECVVNDAAPTPLAAMTSAERYHTDFTTIGLTTGPHPMAAIRDRLPAAWRAADLPLARDGDAVLIAGAVICRQRPGTAKGVVFISLEDETGIANAIVSADLFERRRLIITGESALRITGRLQNVEGVIHVKAITIEPLDSPDLPTQASHDFH